MKQLRKTINLQSKDNIYMYRIDVCTARVLRPSIDVTLTDCDDGR